ncbi:MAG: hypothetical protein KDA24_00590 [Deltaproteobacteria bacterium]|nr:hypothetical protein [Deltaproteobacteria bacterium]
MRPRLPLLLCLACLAAFAVSCKKKAPAPPPEFDSPQRAMTGSTALENRISEAERLERLTEEDLVTLREEGLKVGQTNLLSQYIAARTGRGELQESIDTLMEIAWFKLSNDVAVADLLDLTMGQLKWSACAQIATKLVERRTEPSIFLIRGLCLRRSGDAVNAMENVEASFAKEPLNREVEDMIRRLVDERAAGNQLLPADEMDYRLLRDELGSKGPIHRLFVRHLTERSDPGWTMGSLDWYGVDPQEQRTVILSRSRSYRHCHSLAQYASKAELSGSTTAVWMIDGLGRVVNPKVTESAWSGHEQEEWLNACFLDQLGKLRFPIPKYGRYMPARHKFSFSGR